MDNAACVVERQWHGVAPDGTEHAVALRIGTPVRDEHGDWSVDVSLVPMQNTTYRIIGIDSWQAVDLAMTHLAVLARHYHTQGWRFFWDRGGDVAYPSDLRRNPE